MKAFVVEKYVKVAALRETVQPDPEPGHSDVLVETSAAAPNVLPGRSRLDQQGGHSFNLYPMWLSTNPSRS